MNKLQKLVLSASTSATTLVAAATPAWAQSTVDVTKGTNVEPGEGFATNVGSLLNAVLSIVMVIAALLVFLYLIWGGIEWITSGGDKGKTESARNKITSAVIGLIVVAASYAILTLALNFLGFSDLNDVLNVRTING